MAYVLGQYNKNLEDSSDSESMKDLNLDKDDEDIEFQEEKVIEII